MRKDARKSATHGDGHRHVFSIVIAVYNCEPFLTETLDSIVNQEFDGITKFCEGIKTERPISFEELVEVIMVDDGSTDGSGAICDGYAKKYPNFKVIHKKNGGVASARNAGMEIASGKYINFLDSDDKFSHTVLREVYPFFEQNYDRTDVVTVPLEFFDAVHAPHWQNYKFNKDARVVNLYNDHDCPLMFVNASFFKSQIKDKLRFNGNLVCGEDIRFIFEVVAEKMTMGLLPTARYFYRRRSHGEESLIQSSEKKRGWYFDYLEHLTEWGVDFCRKKWGYIPYYFQNVLVCDLQWRFFKDYETTALSVLGKELYEEYKSRLYAALRHFDDRIILSQRNVFGEHKCLMLAKKYGHLPERCVYGDDALLRFGNTHFRWASSMATRYDFIHITDGRLVIEGMTMLYGYPEGCGTEVFFEAVGDDGSIQYLPCETSERSLDKYRLDELLYRGICFKLDAPADSLAGAKLSLVLYANGERIIKKNISFGKFSPIGNDYKSSYYASEGYTLTKDAHSLRVERGGAVRREIKFLLELMRSDKIGAKKAVGVRILCRLFRLFSRRRIWIIEDRLNKAGDNGEAFFRYLKKRQPRGIRPYFAITRCEDGKRLEPLGSVLYRDTKKFKIAFLSADYIISSSADELATNPFFGYDEPYRDILAGQKFVFLQHGVTQSDISRWLNRFNKNIYGFITAAKKESESILQYPYYYREDNVWQTGFARFDRLYNNEKRLVTVMPTWRLYLASGLDPDSGVWHLKDGFEKSDYFRFYNSLINHPRLLSECENLGYRLAFMPHPNVIPHIDRFDKDARVEFYTINREYRDAYAEASLVVTDYSSAVFDFAYMHKPIIYAQFDYEEFFRGNHVGLRGYFDYARDGFGEVTSTVEETVELIIEYMKNGCSLKDKYRERIDAFFSYTDDKNCERIFKKITESK